MSDENQTYCVVIHGEDGISREHAEMLRERLIRDGFHDHVVGIEEIDGGEQFDLEQYHKVSSAIQDAPAGFGVGQILDQFDQGAVNDETGEDQ